MKYLHYFPLNENASNIYNKIYDFCKIKNVGGAHKNGQEPSNRVKFLINLLDSEGIPYEIDEFTDKRFGDNKFYNIVMLGSSDKMITAHHDIVNPNSDNANDNSASVINAIATKKLRPDVNVILLDGEEPPMMGVGSQRASDKINSGEYGNISWVLNFELSGAGGKNFFIGDVSGGNVLFNKVKELFNCPSISVPFNDSVIFNKNGITSIVINPLPLTDIKTPIQNERGYLNYELLFNCHSMKDSIDTISTEDMKEFVEEVVMKILN